MLACSKSGLDTPSIRSENIRCIDIRWGLQKACNLFRRAQLRSRTYFKTSSPKTGRSSRSHIVLKVIIAFLAVVIGVRIGHIRTGRYVMFHILGKFYPLLPTFYEVFILYTTKNDMALDSQVRSCCEKSLLESIRH